MAGGGGGGSLWIVILVIGVVICGVGYGLEHAGADHAATEPVATEPVATEHAGAEPAEEGGHSLAALLLGVGGLMVIFGSCQAMIGSVEGLGQRLGLNEFVAGTLAGLASNLPEIVMLAFIILQGPRVAFVVVALTLHVSALVFGIYCGLLPRDEKGHARLPDPMVRLSTDLFACAGGIFLVTGTLMILLKAFDAGDHKGEGLGIADLYMIGIALLFVEVVAVIRLVKRFSGATEPEEGKRSAEETAEAPGMGKIVGLGVLGVATSVLGGHAVGDFAGALVEGLKGAGYSEMVGAIVLSIFACAGAYLMIASAHWKGKYDLALANVSGAVNQVPFVVMPISLIMMAIFAQTELIPMLEFGSVLAIDLETTSVVLFGFPIMLILWKSVQDDGTVNWLETAGMVAVFALIVFFLAIHG